MNLAAVMNRRNANSPPAQPCTLAATLFNNPMFWKKKKTDTSHDSKIILGMIMLNDNNTFDIDRFTVDFKNNYVKTIQEPSGDNASFVFRIGDEMVAIAHMDIPIPKGDIEATAQYSYNWQTALEDTKDHKSHLIVSVMQGGQDQIKRFKLFTQVLCSLLRTTNAIGVYKGNQSLLIPKEDYLNEAEVMSEEYLPLNLWIYFGLRMTENGNAGYTYGLKEFNKTEMEIVNSSKTLEDIRGFLFNIAHYVLDYDVAFQDGQTVGGSAEEKIAISFSKGQFVEGETFKLAY
ncbi:DUF4261 domain-containing protein [Niastella caeni]|uniref:DUF4261 domain-containing protein n=1 Tax=Niastella caeni TaxID=2569763 RepID=A0A4S8HR52_9BACT|nr:DUF4261 domain-containing protein [Niastella caeni]THU37967.1 DUF4261 domain-containing protein [Niastella caeni]